MTDKHGSTSQRRPDPNGAEGDDFMEWWSSQDTAGLSDSCRWSAWNAWIASAYRMTDKHETERAAARLSCVGGVTPALNDEKDEGMPFNAEQWLDCATRQLRSLERIFREANWQSDSTLIQGLSIAQSQINEATQCIRSANGLNMRWRDAKVTRPCDGDVVLCFWPPIPSMNYGKYLGEAQYYSGRWYNPENDEDDYRIPSHWMPLPEPPSVEPVESRSEHD